MYKVGVFPGKFMPPHRGHLNAIIQAASQCHKLYVVVSDNEDMTRTLCMQDGLTNMPLKLRAKWLSQELQLMNHVKVLLLDETRIPTYPNGTKEWAALLKKTVPEKFDAIFGGELEYARTYMEHFDPSIVYRTYDYKRSLYPISGTEIRSNPFRHWDYILGSARPYFAKRVLITGVESCGKTTMVKSLAKIYCTSWAEEAGRFYSQRFLGGNEEVFTLDDFGRIAWQQRELEDQALRTANKVVFFDTEAVVTQFYCDMYLGQTSKIVESLVDRSRYDLIIALAPNVPWVADGLRVNSDPMVRWKLHDKLMRMYADRGIYVDRIIDKETYIERLDEAIRIIENRWPLTPNR